MVETGKRYYFIIHAYWHFVARVVEILGKKHVAVDEVVFVYSSKKDWTDFFKTGFGSKETTTYRIFPPGEYTYIAAFEWRHDVPTE